MYWRLLRIGTHMEADSSKSLAVVSEILQGRNARRNVYLALALLIRSLYEVLVTMQWFVLSSSV
jgi:hypothetical protein